MKGRTALVTGASRGIGAAIAARLREGGAKVLTPTRSEMDLSSEPSIDAYVSSLKEPVDVLVNNAGINMLGGAGEIPAGQFAQVLQTNLVGPLRLAGALAAGMKARRYGRIVNLSSIWSVVTRERRVTYSASKAAINGLTRALALELAPHGVLVNAVAPGYVDTELTRRNNSEQDLKAIAEAVPLGRLADPKELAECVAFLCSERNSYLTGQVLVVDGGYTCR
jgi:3-oxoacyl-[acyl-carrier protein] reductase